jgi:hypothetical protein
MTFVEILLLLVALGLVAVLWLIRSSAAGFASSSPT